MLLLLPPYMPVEYIRSIGSGATDNFNVLLNEQ
jgi:hypothetical protein